ncbi:MAG: EFR1 family ferrodoxin [Elusimicrobia bacterium]|nr:EFR1 family ferrodoxin [Elusimicrobiota bacterium]
MKTLIYYFSGTGNSLKVAKEIASGLGDAEIISIHDAIKKNTIVNADKVGFVFPVYMWGVPSIVVDFVKKNQNLKGKYIFSVVTCGGSPGATNVQLKKLVEQAGGILSAAFSVKMPGNYVPLYGAKPLDAQAKLFEKAKTKIAEIISKIKNNESGIVEKNNLFTNLVLSGIVYSISMPHIHEMDKKFWVQDSCNSCGICQKVCPVENISIENGKPFWKHKCEQCMACIQWCPLIAIQYGEGTVERTRYHHPDIKLQEIMK